MAEVKILIKGFTNADKPGEIEDEITCPTISLVRADNLKIICDPGVAEQKDILTALKKEGLSPDDIDIVFITHSHIDHYRNIGMFARAKTLEYWGLWDGGHCDEYGENFTEDIRIIKTPGHNFDALTMLVKTGMGTVAVAGDLFWKENYPIEDPYASDQEKLNASRAQVLALADYIIPGHGDIYQVKK